MDVSMVALKSDLDGVTIEAVEGGYVIKWDEWVLETVPDRPALRDATVASDATKTNRRRIGKTAVREQLGDALAVVEIVLTGNRVTDQRESSE